MAMSIKKNIEKVLCEVFGEGEGQNIMKSLISNKRICTESWG
jgi:hypothetical protein